MEARFLEATLGDPVSNIALEESLFREARVPTLRIWPNQKSVIIGRAQLGEFETDLEYCKSRSVPVLRRFTAGGTVYNGEGNMNWSFFVPRRDRGEGFGLYDPASLFMAVGDLVVGALRRCGTNCSFAPPNSITRDGGKVSGMAAYMSKETVVCHGTLLVDADLGEVERLTMPRAVTIDRKYTRSRFSRVSNCGVDVARFVAELLSGSGYHFEKDEVTNREAELARNLVETKYGREEWNLGDPFSLDYL